MAKVGLSAEPTLESVRDDRGARVYLFCGYDGSLLLSSPLRMPWHNLEVTSQDIQQLHPALRRYPDDYNRVQRLGFKMIRRLKAVLRKIRPGTDF
jgi:hypothetical protein